MGTKYYIIDVNAKTFYDLGKGGWYQLHYNKGAFQYPEYLALFVLENVFTKENHTPIEWDDIVKYVLDRIVPDLFRTFGNSKPEHLRVVNDCTDDITICKSKGYCCIGTRYNEIGSKEHEEDIARMNRHLTDPTYKRLFN